MTTILFDVVNETKNGAAARDNRCESWPVLRFTIGHERYTQLSLGSDLIGFGEIEKLTLNYVPNQSTGVGGHACAGGEPRTIANV